jgi:hypothetical protein
MEETIGKIIESDESNQKKIKQLDDFFGFIAENEEQNKERTLTVSEVLNGRWNVPTNTTGYSAKLSNEEKEHLIHYIYEKKLKTIKRKRTI